MFNLLFAILVEKCTQDIFYSQDDLGYQGSLEEQGPPA